MNVTERVDAKAKKLGVQLRELTEMGKVGWEIAGDLVVETVIERDLDQWKVIIRKDPVGTGCGAVYSFALWRSDRFVDKLYRKKWIMELWSIAHQDALERAGVFEDLLQALDELKDVPSD